MSIPELVPAVLVGGVLGWVLSRIVKYLGMVNRSQGEALEASQKASAMHKEYAAAAVARLEQTQIRHAEDIAHYSEELQQRAIEIAELSAERDGHALAAAALDLLCLQHFVVGGVGLHFFEVTLPERLRVMKQLLEDATSKIATQGGMTIARFAELLHAAFKHEPPPSDPNERHIYDLFTVYERLYSIGTYAHVTMRQMEEMRKPSHGAVTSYEQMITYGSAVQARVLAEQVDFERIGLGDSPSDDTAREPREPPKKLE